jgi:ParB family transcriptional regulator, chromosome partitioning protein
VVARRSGLGRGLGALIPPEATTSTSTSALREVPVSAVRSNPHQPRKHFDEESLASLAASVRELGVLQPVLVRQVGDEYELIAGERRWRAAKRAGLPTIPVVVKEADNLASLEQAVVENLHRQDLNPLEEAAAYQQLLEDFGMTHEQLAERVGKSRVTITNTLRLFQLPPTIQKMVSEGAITAGHARALLGTPDRAFQEALARRIVGEGLSVRTVEEVVRDRADLEATAPSATDVRSGRKPKLRQAGMQELEDLLSEHLATRVQVQEGSGGRGKVVITFADLDDLERLYRAMTEPVGD